MPRFKLDDLVDINNVDPLFQQNCMLISGGLPMMVVGIDYQVPPTEPVNDVQRRFQAAGFWPLLPPEVEGYIYTVRYLPNPEYDRDGTYLIPCEGCGEMRIHEKWLDYHLLGRPSNV